MAALAFLLSSQADSLRMLEISSLHETHLTHDEILTGMEPRMSLYRIKWNPANKIMIQQGTKLIYDNRATLKELEIGLEYQHFENFMRFDKLLEENESIFWPTASLLPTLSILAKCRIPRSRSSL